MKERPILFSGPMVRAIMAGRKTETRRVIRRLASVREGGWGRPRLLRLSAFKGTAVFGDSIPDDPVPVTLRCPAGAMGDRLWVRETWAPMCRVADPLCWCEPEDAEQHHYIEYRADTQTARPGDWPARDRWEPPDDGPVWRPSIFMPRSASRLTLEVTGVGAERLHDITTRSIAAEGIENGQGILPYGPTRDRYPAAQRLAFERAWNMINGKRAPWSENPWVWCVTFRVVGTLASDASVRGDGAPAGAGDDPGLRGDARAASCEEQR